MGTSFVKASEVLKTRDCVIFLETESPIEDKMISVLQRFDLKPLTQVKIGKYRADILLKTKFANIVIECDGAEFHKDKEKDIARDEYMRGKGYIVFRFTGSEIHRNPVGCAMEVIEAISEVYQSKEYQDFLADYLSKQAYRDNYDEDDNLY